jgi:4-carboxymuconolactone decarboxylase
MTNREAGLNIVREMMGDQAAAKLSASADSNTFGAPIAAYAVDHVFADIWTRPGLDRCSRSLVSISVMIAMRQPHEFAIHMGTGLNNGLTLKEIEKVLIQAAIRWLSCHLHSTGCRCRGYQGAWSGRRQKLRWTPRPALTRSGIRTAGVERRLTAQPEAIVS